MIEVNHLTKIYGDHKAVDDLSFTVEDGHIYGFLGPNGAGKSTTMNIITGCLAASSGEVRIGGYDIFEQPKEAKRLIGYLPELPPVYMDKNIREYLNFVADAKGVKKKDRPAEVSRVMELTKITQYEKRLIKNLSKGYRQRVGIAQALLGDPALIILDEPTVGLDPQQIIEVRDLITSLRGKHTVILSSHILSEIQAVCEDILIIAHGKVVACDTTENLEKQFAGEVTVLVTAETAPDTLEAVLKTVPGVRELHREYAEDGKASCLISTNLDDDTALCKAVSEALSEKQIPVLQLTTKRATLEDIFIELTNRADYEEPEEEPETVPVAEKEEK